MIIQSEKAINYMYYFFVIMDHCTDRIKKKLKLSLLVVLILLMIKFWHAQISCKQSAPTPGNMFTIFSSLN